MDSTRVEDSSLLISEFRNDFLSVRNFFKLDKSAPGTLQVPLSNSDFLNLLFIDNFAEFCMDSTRAQDSTLLISEFRNDFLSVRDFFKLDI